MGCIFASSEKLGQEKYEKVSVVHQQSQTPAIQAG